MVNQQGQQAPILPAATGGSVPVPDPTKLTSDAVNAAKDDLRREIEANHKLILVRLEAMDKAIRLVADETEKTPEVIHRAVARLQELHAEKFESIQVQFRERDTRTEQTSKDSKVAVDAALSAAKEAVGAQNSANALSIAKSEAAVTKQIDQISNLIGAMTNGLSDKIDDIKAQMGRQDTRITTIESRGVGQLQQKDDSNKNSTMMIALFAIVISVIGTIISSIHIFTKGVN